MGPYQPTPREVARAIRYAGLGVPVGDFLDTGYHIEDYTKPILVILSFHQGASIPTHPRDFNATNLMLGCPGEEVRINGDGINGL